MKNVAAANIAFRRAGIQFWLRKYEDFDAPDLWNLSDHTSQPTWATVRSELQSIYPSIPSSAWADSFTPNSINSTDPKSWLRLAAQFYAKEDEITVFGVPQGGGCGSEFPESGRAMICGLTVLGDYAGNNGQEGTLYLFSHELGHYFGLRHIFELWGGAGGLNPATGASRPVTDLWDLIYSPGTSAADPHRFFSSRADAEGFASSNPSLPLIPIWQRCDSGCAWMPSNLNHTCADDSGGTGGGAHCQLIGRDASNNPAVGYLEAYYPGDSRLKGINMPMSSAGLIPSGSSPPSQTPQTIAVNAMAYYTDYNHELTFSASQLEVIRQNISFESTISLDSRYYPVGQTVANSYRTRLGTVAQHAPSGYIDFDNDGRRDLVFWRQPVSLTDVGHFTVLLSTHGFRTNVSEELNADLGRLGDTPVLQDYDGDGITDFAVFQPGGGLSGSDPTDSQAYWKWCPSTHAADCPSFTQTVTFGTSESVPLTQLNFDNDPATPEIAAYRHTSNGRGYFDYVGVGTSSVAPATVQLGTTSSVPLPGLYDSDAITDLVVYNRISGAYEMKLSTKGYVSDIVRSFGSAFVGTPGNPAAIAIDGMSSFALGVRRSSLTLWQPSSGSWNTIWAPTPSTPSAMRSCSWGGSSDLPLPGLDYDGDGTQDMAVFRPSPTGGTFYYKLNNVSGGSCAGASHSIADSQAAGLGTIASVVQDMTGDGLPDVMAVLPTNNTVMWYTSENGFATRFIRSFAESRGIVL